ncbi:eCIS core domain-containing protein [Hymenobacter antarcticus]|uniref:eCIS core domain-containing protein n=1 Tax=Hymenobacter antarcticus TaxID=486270 RepID=A0ABP7P2C6_9BACT
MQNPRTWTRSPLARIARLVLGSQRVAMVVGQTVHLNGATREQFLADAEWVAHELVHLRQYKEHGLLPFLWKYLVESARVGYYQNKYEVEAREEARRVVLADPSHVLRPLPRHAQPPSA